MRDLRIVVAGHVDHGKSTLIGRLLYDTGSLPQQVADKFDAGRGPSGAAALAFVTDQLSEEQEGSFTLDTAQAHFRTARGDYTLIDTPGHREFLKNMVTGTTRADAAILVVDVAEGPLPQTYLHAYLIAMLGIRQVIVAINKMDLISYNRHRFEVLSQQLSVHLERIGIIPAAVIPLSAQRGDHVVIPSVRMPWNHTPPLVQALDRLAPPEKGGDQPVRFVVQCSFPQNGSRAILGKVVSGVLQPGRPITFGPHHHETIVTSIRAGRQEIRAATVGQCVGLLLQDPASVERGHIGFDTNHAPVITDRLAAKVFWIHPRPLAVDDEIEVLCGTQNPCGHVETIAGVIDPVSLQAAKAETTRIEDSQVAELTIRTNSSLCIDPFDRVPELGRFAILKNTRIAGGGITTR
jgi:bifunctional enzyme CysN/CysC